MRLATFLSLLLLMGCAPQYQSSGPNISDYANSNAIQVCGSSANKKQGQYLNWAKCYDKELRKNFAQSGSALSKGDELELAKQKALLSKVDKGQLTYEEYLFELDNYHEQLLATERTMQLQNLQEYDLMYGQPRQPKPYLTRFKN
jgi:hypothetical protein